MLLLGGSQENLPMMGCAPLRGGSDLHRAMCPDDEMCPHLESAKRTPDDGMCPHSEDRVCTLLDEMCPHVEVLTHVCLRAFFGSPMGAETLRCAIFPTWSHSLNCRDVPPLRAPDLLLIGCAITRRIRLYTPRRDVPRVKMLMQICL